jgi:hypothetical protein
VVADRDAADCAAGAVELAATGGVAVLAGGVGGEVAAGDVVPTASAVDRVEAAGDDAARAAPDCDDAARAASAGDDVAAAGRRRTTAGSAALAVRTAAAAATADGAAGSDRREVAAETVSAGPVARRSPGCLAGADGVVTSAVGPAEDISGSGVPRPRASVSPGAGVLDDGAELTASAACGVATSAVVAAGCAADVGDSMDRRTTGAGAAGADSALAVERAGALWAGGFALGTEALWAGPLWAGPLWAGCAVAAGALAECAVAAVVADAEAALAARDRGVAAWRSAPHRPGGGPAAGVRAENSAAATDPGCAALAAAAVAPARVGPGADAAD